MRSSFRRATVELESPLPERASASSTSSAEILDLWAFTYCSSCALDRVFFSGELSCARAGPGS